MRPCSHPSLSSIIFLLALWLGGVCLGQTKPNILIAISDDQSWCHASAYGSKMVKTPHFDAIAKAGVLFTHAFAPSPGCSPSRAAFLTGRHTWQIEHAGTHASFFDPKYVTFPDRLAEDGYATGHVGKGWAPGNWKKLGRKVNPAGPKMPGPKKGNYAVGFEHFLKEVRKPKQPFCFWFGSSDPHRSFEKGAGLGKGKRLEDAEVPSFLPDTPEVRSDLLDYTFEVERFDDDLGKMIALLEDAGELGNTIVIATSDNGMAFPRAKANCYEYGIRMPLAIQWPKEIPKGRVIDDLVGFVDLTATLYEMTGVAPPEAFPIVGTSLATTLRSDRQGLVETDRMAVYSARERHSSSRYQTLGYPQRCIRTAEYLYIYNFAPERWPAGPSRKYAKGTTLGPEHGGYHDIDACPTLDHLIAKRDDPELGKFLSLAVVHRPAEELYAVKEDPGCLENLANKPSHRAMADALRGQLSAYLKKTGDARILGNGDVWETYPRVSSLRWFPIPDWATKNPDKVPKLDWLEARRP
ncbi:MAG: sulfatase-like hydrolase/transferase [Verrucomicrobiaceae bacterium]|nr:sulfatase-like hydrolase/transferase [Verrucomicrobiaceae bacterium]